MALSQHPKIQLLTMVNPNSFDSLADIRTKFLKDSVVDTVSAMIQSVVTNIGRGVNTTAPTVGSLINKIAGEVLKQSGIGDDNMDYFKFRINPNKLSVPKKKIVDIKYTGDGYDIDVRGQELIMYSYQASTGSMMPDNMLDKVGLPLLNQLFSILNLGQELTGQNIFKFPEITRNPKLSDAYIKFKLFELFWEKNDDDLLIFWEDDCYLGKFINFNYTVDGLDPYQIKYNFDFAVYPDFKYNLYTGWITENSFSAIKNNSNKYQGVNEDNLISNLKKQALSEIEIETGTLNTSLTNKQESDIEWFSSLGAYPYNKNKTQFLKNISLGFSTDLRRITPKELANWYKANRNIDIFEDNISFNLQKNREKVFTQTTGNNQAQIDSEEIKKEIEFKSEYTP